VAKQRHAAPLSWLQPAILVGSLAPFAAIALRAGTGRLGANPVATALNQLGLLALVFLVASLACTPLKIVLGKGWPVRLRKTLGLLAFFAALAHFSVYAFVDQGAIGSVFRDVVKRPFIAIGFAAFVLLVPLALTSTKASLARLGFTRWKLIHRLVYPSALLAVVHFTMRVKADVSEPLLWGALVFLLFAVRIVAFVRRSPKGRLGVEGPA
jgi:sulfoxide reductase heme-binding subunit YedZ